MFHVLAAPRLRQLRGYLAVAAGYPRMGDVPVIVFAAWRLSRARARECFVLNLRRRIRWTGRNCYRDSVLLLAYSILCRPRRR